MEDGSFRYRPPPKVTWISDCGKDRPSNVIICAKGLIPVLTVKTKDQHNIVIPDIVEIGGIEDFKKKILP